MIGSLKGKGLKKRSYFRFVFYYFKFVFFVFFLIIMFLRFLRFFLEKEFVCYVKEMFF